VHRELAAALWKKSIDSIPALVAQQWSRPTWEILAASGGYPRKPGNLITDTSSLQPFTHIATRSMINDTSGRYHAYCGRFYGEENLWREGGFADWHQGTQCATCAKESYRFHLLKQDYGEHRQISQHLLNRMQTEISECVRNTQYDLVRIENNAHMAARRVIASHVHTSMLIRDDLPVILHNLEVSLGHHPRRFVPKVNGVTFESKVYDLLGERPAQLTEQQIRPALAQDLTGLLRAHMIL
jgi:hypothetical protein